MNRIIALLLLLFAAAASAQAPKTLSYQGKLTDAGGPLNGSFILTFKIYGAASGGTQLWSETSSNVSVTNGNLSIILGKATPINVPTDKALWLGISVGGNPEVTPRVELTASLYSLGLALPFSAALNSSSSLLNLTNTGSGNVITANGKIQASQFEGDGSLLTNLPGGLVLPFSGSSNGASSINISNTNNSYGSAGSFSNADPANNGPVLSVSNSGSGFGVYSTSTNPSNQSYAVFGENNGNGVGGGFRIHNSSNAFPALQGYTDGMGQALDLQVLNSSNTTAALQITHLGTGNAINANRPIQATQFIGDGSLLTNLPSTGLTLPFSSSVSVGTSAFIVGNNNGNYGAALFFSNSASSATLETQSTGNSALNAVHNGANGNAGIFDVQTGTNPGNAIWARTLGTGQVALFRTQNNGSNSSTILAEQQGLGSAGQFDITNNSNNSAAIQINHSGTGNAISANRPIQATKFIGDGSLLTNLPSGLSLPFNGSSSTPGNSFSLTNTAASGGAGIFAVNNLSNTTPALSATSNGIGGIAIQALNNATHGYAGYFQNTLSGNGYPTVRMEANGSSSALQVNNNGTGGAAQFFSGSTSTQPTFWTINQGLGSTSIISTTNSTNPNDALVVQTSGSGRGGWFRTTNTASTQTTLQASNEGLGYAGIFTLAVASNNRAALYAQSTGTTGSALEVAASPDQLAIKMNQGGMRLSYAGVNTNQINNRACVYYIFGAGPTFTFSFVPQAGDFCMVFNALGTTINVEGISVPSNTLRQMIYLPGGWKAL